MGTDQQGQPHVDGRTLPLATTAADKTIALPLKYANRHGLITGATGTGKTTSLQRLAEQFSAAGVPVFAADIKGDLSGIAAPGKTGSSPCPIALWDIFAERGLPIRTSVHELGANLLANMLALNETQAGALAIAFRKAKDDERFFLTLDDLRWALNDIIEAREEICQRYGNVTAASIAAIQRNILALEAQGGAALFGEPPFEITDFMRTANGRGVVNLLHADQLMEAPKLYATFLLWLLTELFRTLPEAGDLDKPKLVFFFDESHLLFTDAPKALLQSIERLVRLVRSKGVGIYFVTQSPSDIPDAVLAQLGNRVQHALRAYTPKDQRLVKAAAQAFRPNKGVDVKSAITQMGVGEALVSLMESDGVPSPVERVRISLPDNQIGPITDKARTELVDASPLRERYGEVLDEAAAQGRFNDRMRAAAGLPPIEHGSAWAEGQFAQFIPDIAPTVERPRRAKVADLMKAIAGCFVAVACFWMAWVF